MPSRREVSGGIAGNISGTLPMSWANSCADLSDKRTGRDWTAIPEPELSNLEMGPSGEHSG